MRWIRLIRKLVGSAIGINTVSTYNTNTLDMNYILAVNPLAARTNTTGTIIMIMIFAIIILIGYTLYSNRK